MTTSGYRASSCTLVLPLRCLVETVRSTASTVGITLAVVPAGRVGLLAVVPTSAVANLLRQLADLGVCVEHLALCAPKLVGGPAIEAREEELAVVWVREDWVGLDEVLGSQSLATGAGEPIDNDRLDRTVLGLVTLLVLKGAASDLLIEN